MTLSHSRKQTEDYFQYFLLTDIFFAFFWQVKDNVATTDDGLIDSPHLGTRGKSWLACAHKNGVK